MKVGGIGETVEVTGARMLESESSDRGQVIGREQIVNLPLNGRAYADLALLSPGVRQSSISTSRDASFNVNGMRSSLNNFILDGVDNNSYGTSNQGFSNQVVQVSPDAVEEFKVQTNNFSAEFGRAGGAVINATFRSGTNDFHGTAWEFNRNTSLNATGFFKPSSGVKPKLSRNQYGGVFGGPIVRNRSFFFVNYEGFRQTSSTVTFASIPTMAQRQGQLGRPIVNPLTGAVYADGVIPASAITPFARSVLDGLPAPTRPGTSNNFDSLPERTDDNDKVDVKVDQQFGSQTSGFVRFSHRKVNNFEPPPIPGETSSPSNAFVEVLNQQLALGVTRTLSSRSLLEVRFGLSRTKAGKTALGTGTPEHVRALRHHRAADRRRVRGRPHPAVGDRLDGVGSAEQQSAVPGSARPGLAHQLLDDLRHAHAEDRLRVPAHQHRRRRRPSEVRVGYLRRPVQPAGRSGRGPRDLQPRRLHVRRAEPVRPGQPVRLPAAAADALRLRAGRLARELRADGEPGAALRGRNAAVGGRATT